MSQGKLGCLDACVNYNGKQHSLNIGQSETKVAYKHDIKRVKRYYRETDLLLPCSFSLPPRCGAIYINNCGGMGEG